MKCLSIVALLLAVFFSTDARAQEKYKFVYDSTQTGDIPYQIFFRPEGAGNNSPITGKLVDIDFGGAKSGVITIQFLLKRVHIDNGFSLYVRSTCFRADEFFTLSPESDTAFTATKKSKGDKSFVFNVLKNGSTQLRIGYDILGEKGVVPHCARQFIFPIKISGIANPAADACEEALAKFPVNKLAAIDLFEKIRTEYPAAPCIQEIKTKVDEYKLYKNATDQSATNCAETRRLCKEYQSKYIGANAHWQTEIEALMVKCKETGNSSVGTKPAVTAPPVIPKYKLDWEQLQKRKSLLTAADFQGYIDQYENDIKAADYVKLARSALTRIAPLRVSENRINDFERIFTIANASHPRWKDMSLIPGLKVDDSQLDSLQILKVNLETGEFALRIVDANNKDTIIRLSNAFAGEMNLQQDGQKYFIKVSGGRKPYTITLEDIETGAVTTLQNNLRTDTTVIQLAELKAKGLNGEFRVRLKGSGLNEEIDLGLIHYRQQQTALLAILFWGLGIIALWGLAYLLYILLVKRRRKKAPQQFSYTQ